MKTENSNLRLKSSTSTQNFDFSAKGRVLLVAGSGTLGGALYPELVAQGWCVDVVSLEDFKGISPRLNFIKARADEETLRELYATRGPYDAVVDFLHTPDLEALYRRIDLNLAHTDQFVYLSSYRTYSDVDSVVTERTPQWLDVTHDENFLKNDTYAIPKSQGERHLRKQQKKNWTIVRPLISFSHYRLDLVTVGAYALLYRTAAGKRIPLPVDVRDKHAGVGWAGNVGRELAALIGNPAARGEDFTLGSGETLTWGDVAGYYEELLGCQFEWIPTEDYLAIATANDFDNRQMIYTDRILDRTVDISKVLRVTGVDPKQFVSCREGIARELAILSERPDLVARFDTPARRALDEKMDRFFSEKSKF